MIGTAMTAGKTFSSLLSEVSGLIEARGDSPITGVASDSRQVQPGDLFIAYRGFEADGHSYIEAALMNGAVAVLFQDARHEETVEGVPWARVADSRLACAEVAAAFFDHPSRAMKLAAVTGTNGKTTTTFMISAIMRAAGMRAGVIGTLGYGPADDLADAARTTPDAIELQSQLRHMADAGIEGVAMETSSHALVLARTWRCAFDVGVFTNLSQDHLDFHHDLDEYLQAKLLLFTDYPAQAAPYKNMVGALNLDDPFGRRIAQSASCPVLGYGRGDGAPVHAASVVSAGAGSSFTLLVPGARAEVELGLPGAFNVYNALAAAAAGHAMGIDAEAIALGLHEMDRVPGRFERVDRGQPFEIVVDYAHTPEALANVMRVARTLQPRHLIVVFGCGGDRDRDKRPKMGRIATQMADRVIITSDNPRSEDPLDIIGQIRAGAEGDGWEIEPDRRAAIARALQMAAPGDLVLVAGKGHEDYQIFADRTIHFDDREVAAELLAELGY
ncbi:MAG TPA: UDP-N-acetylmuramoyl-L-alanyl-D-glutamate--2,6-diaminopimelate ligase [Armatimonadota bacterium]|nr:UDP-N-acetylmuramoyl-L-alanyl-D-glutamate--2,6-diaminopimelate ligase [Armatimonadota bacterium]